MPERAQCNAAPRRIAVRLLATWGACALSLVASACHRAVVAPVGGHRPEPVAPLMFPAAVVNAAPSLTETLRQLADSAFGAAMWRNARWGVLMVDATAGDTLLSHDANRLFVPASNQKLLTAAVALQQLGPEYRWRTPVMLRGVQRGNRWVGDVLVAGSGDPTIGNMVGGDGAPDYALLEARSTPAFAAVLDALRARGITRIAGDVATIGDAFAGPTAGFGWEMDDQDAGYGAPVDELLFNEGYVTIRVYGGAEAGAPVRVMRAPTTSYPPLAVHVDTRDSVARRDRVLAEYDSTGLTLHLSGSVGVGDSVMLNVSYRHPNDAFRAALREQMVASGIVFAPAPPPRISSRARNRSRRAAVTPRVDSLPLDTLVVLESPTLRQILPRMQKPSQNQIAELLFRTSGLHASGDGSADSARAVATRTLLMLGVAADQLAYRDGSGMSRHNYVSPQALVTVLDAMRRAPTFATFRDALPLAGVDGNLANRMRGTAAAGNAYAKTGTVDKVRSLSGYVTTADGHQILFSILCNNFTVSNREVDRVAELLVTTLAAGHSAPGVPRGR